MIMIPVFTGTGWLAKKMSEPYSTKIVRINLHPESEAFPQGYKVENYSCPFDAGYSIVKDSKGNRLSPKEEDQVMEAYWDQR